MSIASLQTHDVAKLRLAKRAHDHWQANDNQRDKGLNPNPNDIDRYNDLIYGPDHQHNRLDVFKPARYKNEKLPLIIYMHGGGFVYGYRKTYQFYCMNLARAGFAVVCYGYRLAPKYPFPCAWNDTQLAVQWCVKNAGRYGFDLNNVFVIGDSAGANLVEQYLTVYSNPVAADKFHFQKPALRIAGGIFNCGVFFIDKILSFVNPVESTYYTPQVMDRYSDFVHMENYIQKPFVPVFVETASSDDMMNQSVRMDQMLSDRGIPHLYKIYGNDEAPRDHDFQVNQRDPISHECYQDETKFFKDLMAREKVWLNNERALSQITL